MMLTSTDRKHIEESKQILTIELKGAIFFGSSNRILDEITGEMGLTTENSNNRLKSQENNHFNDNDNSNNHQMREEKRYFSSINTSFQNQSNYQVVDTNESYQDHDISLKELFFVFDPIFFLDLRDITSLL